jgi:hypothetical protein
MALGLGLCFALTAALRGAAPPAPAAASEAESERERLVRVLG